jgi:hypothetical protein
MNLTASQAVFQVHSSSEVCQQLPILSRYGPMSEDTSVHSRSGSVKMKRMESRKMTLLEQDVFDLTEINDGAGNVEFESDSYSKYFYPFFQPSLQ